MVNFRKTGLADLTFSKKGGHVNYLEDEEIISVCSGFCSSVFFSSGLRTVFADARTAFSPLDAPPLVGFYLLFFKTCPEGVSFLAGFLLCPGLKEKSMIREQKTRLPEGA